jgi:hypothetical protein
MESVGPAGRSGVFRAELDLRQQEIKKSPGKIPGEIK